MNRTINKQKTMGHVRVGCGRFSRPVRSRFWDLSQVGYGVTLTAPCGWYVQFGVINAKAKARCKR